MKLDMRFYEFVGAVHLVMALICGMGAVGLAVVAKEHIEESAQKEESEFIVNLFTNPEGVSLKRINNENI